MATGAQQALKQYSSITLDHVEDIYSALKSSEKVSPTAIDLSHVAHIDTAGAQLLLAYAISTNVTYQNCSQALTDFLAHTGLMRHFPLEQSLENE